MIKTHSLLMLRPNNFGYNPETKGTNSFQNIIEEDEGVIREKAIHEFDEMVSVLKENEIKITVLKDYKKNLPDAVFMNNWLSIFPDGKLVQYPLATKNRRKERSIKIINQIIEKLDITEFIDLSEFENQNEYLEGTGSIVFDHDNKIAYASLSQRTSENIFNALCDKIGYKGFVFTAQNLNNQNIYHTNVLLTITKNYSIVCLDSIGNILEKSIIKSSLENTGKKIIDISFKQLNAFLGNCFEVFNAENKSCLIMSNTAHAVLTEKQKKTILKYSKLIIVNIPIIERVGGGSARCMLTGVNC